MKRDTYHKWLLHKSLYCLTFKLGHVLNERFFAQILKTIIILFLFFNWYDNHFQLSQLFLTATSLICLIKEVLTGSLLSAFIICSVYTVFTLYSYPEIIIQSIKYVLILLLLLVCFCLSLFIHLLFHSEKKHLFKWMMSPVMLIFSMIHL